MTQTSDQKKAKGKLFTLVLLCCSVLSALLAMNAWAGTVHVQGQVDFVPGLNLLGLPVDPTVVPDSHALLPVLGDATQIDKVQWLNPATGKYEETAYDAEGTIIGDTFPVQTGDGWLVYAKTSVTLNYDVTLTCPQYSLHAGINLVSFPHAGDALTAYTLLDTLGGPTMVSSVQGLDPKTGQFQTAGYLNDTPTGPDFPILPDRGYFVLMHSAMVYNPAPVLDSLNPDTVSPGSGDIILTLNGSHFVPGSVVDFGGTLLTPTLLTATQIQVTIPASALTTPGTIQVSVNSAAPGCGTSNTLPLNVSSGGAPEITQFTPTSGLLGTVVTIDGSGFDPVPSNNQVEFNGTSAIVSSASPTQIITNVPQAATTGPITVTTLQGTAASADTFTVTLSNDFDLNLSPATADLLAGSYRYLAITASGTNDFSGLISLTYSPLPAGLSMVFLPPQISPETLSTIEVIADSSLPPATYPVTITGTGLIDGNVVTRDVTLFIHVLGGETTTLSGQVLSTDNEPVSGVFVTLGNSNSTTDAAGHFFLSNVPTGHQMVLVDGRTAITPGSFYPEVVVSAELTAGTGNVLPYMVYLPKIDTAHPIALPVDGSGTTTQPFTATTPAIPNMEVNIPEGTTIIDPDGNPVSQITITAVPPDRSPMPFPEGGGAAMLFTIQPGGSSLSQPVPITFPNLQNAAPGERADFSYFDVTTGAWVTYGQGTVSADGRQVVPDPGVGIPRFAWHKVRPQDVQSPTPSPENPPKQGDPVDMSTGLFTMEKADMVIPGRLPIVLTRYYHSAKSVVGPFGFGTGNRLSPTLTFAGTGDGMLLLIAGDDSRMPFNKNAVGNYTNSTNPSMAGAIVTISGSDRILTFKNKTVWTFNATGALISQEDRHGNSLTFERDGNGNLLSAGEPSGGRRLTFSYSNNLITRVTDPIGRTVQYGYDGNQRLIAVTDPAGGVTHYGYDAAGRMTTLADARGITFLKNTYDDNNRVIKQVNADGGVYQYQYYGPNGQAKTSVPLESPGTGTFSCPVGEKVVITVNAGEPIPSRTNGCLLIVLVVVPSPADDLVTQSVAIDPMGNITSYRFNGQGYLIEEVRPDGSTVRYERAIGTNQLLSVTDALRRKTALTYDAANNITSIIDPAGNVTHFTYEPTFNQVASVTDPLNQTTTFEYDATGNLTKTTDALGHVTTLSYDRFGQPTSLTDPLGNTAQIEYDAVGNITATVDPLGNRATAAYDEVSRLIGATDPNGFTTKNTFDLVNQVTEITDRLNGRTNFTYDPNGNLLTLKDAKGQTTSYTYDSMDHVMTRTDPLNRQESYAYDLNGNLTNVTDRKGQTNTFTYDALDRQVQADFADGSQTQVAYDAAGRVIRATDSASGTNEFSYDILNRLVRELSPQGVVNYNHDALGRRTTMTVNGQSPVTYQYDVLSRLTQVAQGTQVVGLGYDANSRRTSLSYPNGVTTSYGYDPASQLTSILHQGPAGVVESLTYSYDAAGNRIGMSRANGPASLLPDPSEAAYDAANEQIQFNSAAPNLSYDANGNLTSQSDTTGTTTYTWDARNRLIAISGPSLSASFVYDALGRRVSKTINGETTEYGYDGHDIVTEYGPQGGATYLRGLNIDEPFIRQSSKNEYYHMDALKSVFALTDEFGLVQNTYQYDPFGKTTETGASGNPFQYTGRENDQETGEYYFRARYYNSEFQRFISVDKVTSNPSLNRYQYARGNPLRFTDALGLQAQAGNHIIGFAYKKSANVHGMRLTGRKQGSMKQEVIEP